MRTKKSILAALFLVIIAILLCFVALRKHRKKALPLSQESLETVEKSSVTETLDMESLALDTEQNDQHHSALGSAIRETEGIVWPKDKIHFVNMDSFYNPEMTLPLDAWSRIRDETDSFLKSCGISAWELSGVPGSLQLTGNTFQLKVIPEDPTAVLTIFYHADSQVFDFRYEDENHVYSTENSPK